MIPHPEVSTVADHGDTPNPTGFPRLPIISPSEVKALSQREKYGGLYYLGIAGLVILIALMVYFFGTAWSLRNVWRDVYALHDNALSETERIQAAFRLTKAQGLSDAQLMQMSLERGLPDLARYLLAEAVSTDAVGLDPRGYALAVVKSEGWPDWLRLILARRLAYGAGRGYAIPKESLEELARHSDPMIQVWAKYGLSKLSEGEPALGLELWKTANGSDASAELAKYLVAALPADEAVREPRLDQATDAMRKIHPQASAIWKGWEIQDGRLVRVDKTSPANK
jgi:hypothetical protein